MKFQLRAHLAGCTLALLTALAASAQVSQMGEWKTGQVVLSVPGNQIEVVDSSGSIIDTGVSLGTSGHVGGCAPDSSYRIRCIDYDNDKVVRFALQEPHAPTTTLSLSSQLKAQSILYTGLNNDFLVGFAGGAVQRFGYAAANNDAPTTSCLSLPVDASSTFWMDIFSDQATVVYTSGVASGSKGTVRSFNLRTCAPLKTPGFSLKLNKGEALYGVRALPSCSLASGCLTPSSAPNPAVQVGVGNVNGSAGYLIALGTDILRVDSSGNPIKCYVSGLTLQICPTSSSLDVDGASNNWRAVWLSPDANAFWAVNLETGHLFEFKISDGSRLAGPIATSARSSDAVAGLTVEGASDAAQPVVRSTNFFLTASHGSATTQSATFSDPACSSATPPSTCTSVKPSTITISVNGQNDDGTTGDVTDNFLIRFTEVDPIVATSDPIPVGSGSPGLNCTKESQDGNNCVVWDVERTLINGGPGTFDMVFFSPYDGTHPTLLANLETDVLSLISQDLITKTGDNSVFTNNELAQAVYVSGGWQTPITDTADNLFTGGSISTKFTVFDSNGAAIPTASFNCSTSTPQNCPKLSVNLLRDRQAPLQILFTPQGNTGNSGTADLIFRVADATTWIVTVDPTGLQAGCYVFTGLDPFDRFAPFSYSTTTRPLTTILRIGTSEINGVNDTNTCIGLAGQLNIDAR